MSPALEKLTQLEHLNLRGNPSLTIVEINRLQRLLPKCNIKHSAPLSEAESAKFIKERMRKGIERSEASGGTYGKETLHLSHNRTIAITELENLTQLKTLSLSANQLTDVKGLEKLTKLKRLSLGQNKLTDVKGLEKLDQLTFLSLVVNQLTELPKGLEKLTQLKSLDLDEVQIN